MSAIEANQILGQMLAYGVFVIQTPYGRYITRIELIEVIESGDLC
jgi:hypothetical protein